MQIGSLRILYRYSQSYCIHLLFVNIQKKGHFLLPLFHSIENSLLIQLCTNMYNHVQTCTIMYNYAVFRNGQKH